MATTAATITASISPVPTSPAAGPSAVTISTAALAVSLASFLLAGLTLFKGLFETAEGYKRCGEPSIGPWSRMTWRRWRWYELRFETHFIAPKISINRHLPDDAAIRGDGVSSLRRAKPFTNRSHPFTWRPTSRWSRKLAFSQCKAVLEETLSLENGADDRLDLESQHHRSPNTFPTENKVSWLLLVRALYDLANHYSEQMQFIPTENGKTNPTSSIQHLAAGETASDDVSPAVQSTNAPSTHTSRAEAATQDLSPAIVPAGAPPTSKSPSKLSTTQAPTTAATLAGAASGVGLPGNPSSGGHGISPKLLSAATTAQISSAHTSPEGQPATAMSTANQPAQASPTQALSPKAASNDNSVTLDRLQAEFAISFLEWTWDIMPKDAIRPMAKTTLGELIILGFRLGMKWRVDLSKDSFVAHGQGYGLVCTPQGDMGLVATFTRDGWHGRERTCPELIPSRATDKLMCGIIPVSKELGDDIYCISDEGHMDILPAVIERIGSTSSGAQRALIAKAIKSKVPPYPASIKFSDPTQTGLAIVANEAVALLCDFLPLPEVPSAGSHYFPGWTPNMGGQNFSALGSPYNWIWSLRKIKSKFLRHFPKDSISARTKSLVESAVKDLSGVIKDIGFNALPTPEMVEARNGKPLPMQAVAVCRKVFSEISEWFCKQPSDDSVVGRVDYTCLVAAHCYMSIQKYSQAQQGSQSSSPSQAVETEEVFLTNLRDACFYDLHLYLTKDKSFFGEYLDWGLQATSDESHKDFREKMTLGWLLMFLKGLAWSMSTRGMAMGEAVPSSCFDHPRNVWIL